MAGIICSHAAARGNVCATSGNTILWVKFFPQFSPFKNSGHASNMSTKSVGEELVGSISQKRFITEVVWIS